MARIDDVWRKQLHACSHTRARTHSCKPHTYTTRACWTRVGARVTLKVYASQAYTARATNVYMCVYVDGALKRVPTHIPTHPRSHSWPRWLGPGSVGRLRNVPAHHPSNFRHNILCTYTPHTHHSGHFVTAQDGVLVGPQTGQWPVGGQWFSYA